MEHWERELYVSRILFGKIAITVGDYPYYFSSPNLEHSYLANIKYQEILNQALEEGLPTDEEVVDWLVERKLWGDSYQGKLDEMITVIEDLKIKLYNSCFRSIEANSVRNELKKARANYATLYTKRHQLDHLTATGVATLAKLHYTTALSLEDRDGNKLFDASFECDTAKGILVMDAAEEYRRVKLDEIQLRELARTEPWRRYWSISKGNVFGTASRDLNEEQITIVLWSKMYDSVYEAHESPHESVIEDDDCLDGWMLIQKREREAKQMQNQAEEAIGKNDKIANAKNVFLVVDTLEDAKKLNKAMNDGQSQLIKRQRAQMIKEKGKVKHYDLPDMHNELIEQVHAEFSKKVKGV